LRRRRGRSRPGQNRSRPRRPPRQGRDRRPPLPPAGALVEGLSDVTATAAAFDPGPLAVASPEHSEQHGYPHAEWTWLRRHAPVFWYDRPRFDPFWAITKHADIIELSK